MYEIKKLNSKRLEFIIENCTNYMTISSKLINTLMKNNNIELLNIIFKKHLKFFDKDCILNLLFCYNNQTPLSDADLYPQINSEKYKISVKWNMDFYEYNSSYYLFNACKSGNKIDIYGAIVNKIDIYGKTPFIYACRNGNVALVKYLVEHGARVKKK